MDISNYLYLSVILFTIGALGVLIRRNAIVIFMCIELMLNASNLALVTFSRIHGNLDGQVASFFTMGLPFSLKRSWSPTDQQLSTSGWALMVLILVKVRRVRSS